MEERQDLWARNPDGPHSERLTAWADALDSFDKARGQLRKDYAMCALGVGCDLCPWGKWVHVHGRDWAYRTDRPEDGKPTMRTMPPSVIAAYGITEWQADALSLLSDLSDDWDSCRKRILDLAAGGV